MRQINPFSSEVDGLHIPPWNSGLRGGHSFVFGQLARIARIQGPSHAAPERAGVLLRLRGPPAVANEEVRPRNPRPSLQLPQVLHTVRGYNPEHSTVFLLRARPPLASRLSLKVCISGGERISPRYHGGPPPPLPWCQRRSVIQESASGSEKSQPTTTETNRNPHQGGCS